MLSVRRFIRRFANAAGFGGDAPFESSMFKDINPLQFDQIKQEIKDLVLFKMDSARSSYIQNKKMQPNISPPSINDIINNDLMLEIGEMLESKGIRGGLRNLDRYPKTRQAVLLALNEVKSDPRLIQPQIQQTKFKYPSETTKEMWDWMAQNGGSSMMVPDEFLSPANQQTWNTIVSKWQLKQQMKEWLKEYGHNGKLSPPPEFTNNKPDMLLSKVGINNGNAGLFDLAKQEIASGVKDNSDESDQVAGISSEELASTFRDNYSDYIEKLLEESDGSVDPFALIRDYAFRSEAGGKSKIKSELGRTRTFQDQRLNFFWENPQFIPAEIASKMPTNEKDAFTYMYKNADVLTQVLVNLMEEKEPAVQNYVARKVSNKTSIVSGGQIGVKGPSQFGADNEGNPLDIKDTKQETTVPFSAADAVKQRSESANKILNVVSDVFKEVTSSMRNLSKDIVSYMRRKKNPSRATFTRAAFIEGYVEAAMNEIDKSLSPNNQQSLENVQENAENMGFSDETVAKIKRFGLSVDADFNIDLQKIQWSKLVSLASGAEIVDKINDSAHRQGLNDVIERFPTFDQFISNPSSLLERSLKNTSNSGVLIENYPALYSTSATSGGVKPLPNAGHPEYNKQLEKFYKTEKAAFYKRIYVKAELAIDDFNKYIVWLASTGKYSKNLLISFLHLLRTQTTVRKGKYPGFKGTGMHPSPKAYQDLMSDNYEGVQEDPDFNDQKGTTASIKFNLVKLAISRISDLVELKKKMPYKTASISDIDNMIEQTMNDTFSRLDALE